MRTREELQKQWEHPETTDNDRLGILEDMKEIAESDGYYLKCSKCRELVIYLPLDHPVGMGHIYSDDGVREYDITRLCEYCFDEITKEPDEDQD